MSSWFVRPDTVRLNLSEGQWILVRQRLNIGEQRAAQARTYTVDANGQWKLDPQHIDQALVVAYLLDWSLTDDDGKPVVIRGLAADALAMLLDNLAPERFGELRDAITAHIDAVTSARTEEKKTQSGGTDAAPISSSPSAADGRQGLSVN